MDYIALPDNATRQMIDATTVFHEHRRVQQEARRFAGGMYWKHQGTHQYLVRTNTDNRQSRLGTRSPETEQIYENFTQGKQAIEQRLRSLRSALAEAERMNRAVKAGRTPALVVALLQTIEAAGLQQHFTVVGTHALYAYEAAAGVRIAQAALATQDVDLLWDARKRLQFITDMARLDLSMLRVLQKADPSFRRKPGQHETAINDKGFEVDFLRRMAEGDDAHPFRFSADEDDLWPVQARRATVLTEAPRFEQVVIASTGRMANMSTIAPGVFVEFKRWMGTAAPDRPAPRRRRDLRQADIVARLMGEGLLAG